MNCYSRLLTLLLIVGWAGVVLSPVVMESLVKGKPAEWLVTALDQSVKAGPVVFTLDEVQAPFKVFEHGGFYRVDGKGFLFEREYHVLRLLAEGYLYKKVAVELDISIKTLCEHIRRIYRKLHVHSREEAITHYRSRA